MKKYTACFFIALSMICSVVFCQNKIENVVLVTLDGMRWQDVFTGMDSAIANDFRFNEHDSAALFTKYWNADVNERRKKLFPFLWTTIAGKGQLYGNRLRGNKVDNANPYWFSYPGYSEILCGYVDTAINTNDYPNNPHATVLEFINAQPGFKQRVAAFCAWDAFDRIINEQRSGIPVVSAFQECGDSLPNPREMLLNSMLKDSPAPWGSVECLDLFTHYEAMEYLSKHYPRVLYIAYGETDEWAHEGRYKSYLNAAHQTDAWLGQIWTALQNDTLYQNKTALFITVDHGRGGKRKDKWTSHGQSIEDAHEIWFAVLGPEIPAKGEMITKGQFYQKQFAQTIASLLGLKYIAQHPVSDKINLFLK